MIEKLFTRIDHRRFKFHTSIEKANHFGDIFNTINFQIIDNSSLAGILFWQNKTFKTFFTRFYGNRQHTFNRL